MQRDRRAKPFAGAAHLPQKKVTTPNVVHTPPALFDAHTPQPPQRSPGRTELNPHNRSDRSRVQGAASSSHTTAATAAESRAQRAQIHTRRDRSGVQGAASSPRITATAAESRAPTHTAALTESRVQRAHLVSAFHGACWARAHCSSARWPPSAASVQVDSSHGAGGFWARAHCSSSR